MRAIRTSGGVAVACVAAILLTAPTQVGAATVEYAGEIADGGSMSLEVKKKPSGKVAKFFFAEFPVDCENGFFPYADTFPSAKVRNGQFRAEVSRDHGDGTMTVQGTIEANPPRAYGWLAVHGNAFPGGKGCNAASTWYATPDGFP